MSSFAYYIAYRRSLVEQKHFLCNVTHLSPFVVVLIFFFHNFFMVITLSRILTGCNTSIFLWSLGPCQMYVDQSRLPNVSLSRVTHYSSYFLFRFLQQVLNPQLNTGYQPSQFEPSFCFCLCTFPSIQTRIPYDICIYS